MGCGELSWEQVGLKIWGVCYSSPQKPIVTFHLEPATTASTFPNFSVSKCWASSSYPQASSFRKLALLSRPSPWKKKYRNRNVKWKIEKEQQKSKAIEVSGKKREPTSCSNFCASTSSNVGNSPTSIQLCRIPSSSSSFVSTSASSSLSDSSAHDMDWGEEERQG